MPSSPKEPTGGARAGSSAKRVEAGRVDMHVHVFPPEMIRDRQAYLERDTRFGELYRSPDAPMVTGDEVVAHMALGEVDLSVVAGFPFADQGLCRMVNDYILDVVQTFPDRLAGLACVAPDAPGAVAELERCLDAGMVGCGELGPESDGPGLNGVADCVRERGLALLVHSNEPVGHHYPGKGRFTPESCYALAEAYPGLCLVFAHMAGGLFLYELMPEVRRTLADVYYDTAAVPYLYGPEIYEVAVSCAGPEKIVFGTDFPLLPASRYEEGLMRLEPATRAAVEGGNARRVFGL